MKKKTYVTPVITIVKPLQDHLMLNASVQNGDGNNNTTEVIIPSGGTEEDGDFAKGFDSLWDEDDDFDNEV